MNKYQKHKEICDSLNELYITKNKEYGDSFGKAFKEFGPYSGTIDIYHKMQRLIYIVKNNGKELEYESIEDTLRDLANYSIMLLVEMEQRGR